MPELRPAGINAALSVVLCSCGWGFTSHGYSQQLHFSNSPHVIMLKLQWSPLPPDPPRSRRRRLHRPRILPRDSDAHWIRAQGPGRHRIGLQVHLAAVGCVFTGIRSTFRALRRLFEGAVVALQWPGQHLASVCTSTSLLPGAHHWPGSGCCSGCCLERLFARIARRCLASPWLTPAVAERPGCRS